MRSRRGNIATRSWRRAMLAVLAAVVVAGMSGVAGALSSRSGAGGWERAGPAAFTDQLVVAPRSDQVVAGGAGLWITPSTLDAWQSVGPFSSSDLVFGLTVPTTGPTAIYVGASSGLWSAPSLEGPYQRLDLPAEGVRRIVVSPSQPTQVWVSSAQGFWRSDDGGQHWQPADAGVTSPGFTWALTWYQGALYGADADHVYQWSGSRWSVVSDEYYVVSLETVGGRLWAPSMGDGIWVRAPAGGWAPSDIGLTVRTPSGHTSTLTPTATSPYCGLFGRPGPGPAGAHVVTLTTAPRGPIYAGTMLDGIDTSRDQGATWRPFAPKLATHGVIWQVIPLNGRLVVATDSGVLSRPV